MGYMVNKFEHVRGEGSLYRTVGPYTEGGQGPVQEGWDQGSVWMGPPFLSPLCWRTVMNIFLKIVHGPVGKNSVAVMLLWGWGLRHG